MGTTTRTIGYTVRSIAARGLLGLPLTLVALPLVLQHMSMETYGVWATLGALLAVGRLADAGVRIEIIRRVGAATGTGDMNQARTAVLEGVQVLAILGGTLLVLSLAALPWVEGGLFPHLPEGTVSDAVPALYSAVIVLLVLELVAGGYFAALPGLQRSDIENWAILCSGLAGFVTLILALIAGAGIWAFLASAAAGFAVSAAFQTAGLHHVAPSLRVRFKESIARPNWHYLHLSWMILLSQVSNVVDFQFDKIILARYVDNAAAGAYQIGSSIVIGLRELAIMPLGILLAGVAELSAQREGAARKLFREVTPTALAGGAIALSAVILFAPAFVRLWLGAGFDRVATASQLLGAAMVVNLVAAPWVLYALGRGWYSMCAWGSAVNIVVNGVCSFTLTTQIGFRGALYGSIAGNGAATVVFFILFRRRGQMQLGRLAVWPLALIAPCALAAAAIGATSASLEWWQLLAMASLYAMCCIALLVITRVVDLDLVRRVLWSTRQDDQ